MLLYIEYERDPEDNPADFFLDTIIKNEVTLDMVNQTGMGISMQHTISKFSFSCVYFNYLDEENFSVSPLPDRFKENRKWEKLKEELDGLFKLRPHIDDSSTPTYPTSALRQVRMRFTLLSTTSLLCTCFSF